MLIQAEQSGGGRAGGPAGAANWGDLVFVIYPNLQTGRQACAEFKDHLEQTGRGRVAVKIAPAVCTVMGESLGEAEDKLAALNALSKPVSGLASLFKVLNVDFASKGHDEPFTIEEMAGISAIQAFRDRVVKMNGHANPTPHKFVVHTQRGTLVELPVFCDTASQGADQMQEWNGTACDGFIVASHAPGAYEDVVRPVVPELQRRGVFRTGYEGRTLRENLGSLVP